LSFDARSIEHVDAAEGQLDMGMSSWRSDAELVQSVQEARRRLDGRG
jgi:hypothetical protein